jgi:hypothetical protein
MSGARYVCADELQASAPENVSLTVYNSNFGLVKEVRSIDLHDGMNELRVGDVAQNIEPTTVSLTSLTAPNSFAVREQNYQYDLINSLTILSKSVGKHVKIRQHTVGGGVSEIEGTLLNVPTDHNNAGGEHTPDLVIKTNNGIVVHVGGEIELAELPEGLISKPSLLWDIESEKAGKQKVELGYQTTGLNWKCDYVAVVNADDSAIDLTSWVTLDNQSGATYRNAALKLLAGDVHTVNRYTFMPRARAAGMAMASMAPAQQFQEQSFEEYHLYALQRRTDVRDKETKQLSLFNADGVKTHKRYIMEVGENRVFPGMQNQDGTQKVAVKLEIVNNEASHLGMPLPKGTVRVYKRDKDGSLQFIGEDEIDHTPKDEKIRVLIGNAFDVVGQWQETNSERLSNTSHRDRYSVKLRNHKDSAVTVTVVQHAYGYWKVVDASAKFTQKNAHTFEFDVDVPANGEADLTYGVEYHN